MECLKAPGIGVFILSLWIALDKDLKDLMLGLL